MTDQRKIIVHLAGLNRSVKGFHARLKEATDEISFQDSIWKTIPPEKMSFLSSEVSAENFSDCRIISFFSQEYPKLLKKIQNPPYLLFLLGNLDVLPLPAMAVVGSRECTDYGREQARTISTLLSEKGYTIVSGLARGIDTVAHETALACKIPTIGVLACGINADPGANVSTRLMEKITGSGLLLSEFLPHSRPTRFNYPIRNRLISGLSLGTVIVEAAEKSGSLITGNCAFNQHREVFAVPGRITDRSSLGCLKMIFENKAKALWKMEILHEVLPDYSSEIQKLPHTNTGLTEEQALIFNLIKTGKAIPFDRLLRESGFSQGTLASILIRLESSGMIRKVPGNCYKAEK
ncbi:MAG: DNA-processing protein DprA [Candidatus Wallbacteria bacterium]|nr:DNA-processing protein DprA [Candidatus Wallbacteria bacterium]